MHCSIVLKQDHGATRGIEPLAAANGHAANLPTAIAKALQEGHRQGLLANTSLPEEIDAIAVTQGPGMAACLTQGLSMAKLLSALWDRPLVYVHHMVAHTLTPLLTEHDDSPGDTSDSRPIRAPFLVFLLSGGHTQLVLCESFSQFRILAATRDNSIGDAFDKAARAFNIAFDWSSTAPGAALESFARPGESFDFPVPVRGRAEFSYSGLLSSIPRLIKAQPGLLDDDTRLRAAAFAFQAAAFAQIQDKIKMVFRNKIHAWHLDPTLIGDLVVSGGVASNATLRLSLAAQLQSLERTDVKLHFPPPHLCTDNAAMIAHAALVDWRPTRNLSLKPRARWSMEGYAG